MKKYLDSEGVKFLWKDIIKPYINNYVNNLKDSQIIVSDNFEGAENDKGLRHVVRKNKLIAILKDGHVEYAPEGIAYVDAIEPTSFTIGTTTYEVPAGVSYVELGLTTPITTELYQKGIYNVSGIRRFGLYLDGSQNTSLGLTFSNSADLEWLDLSGLDTSAVTYGYAVAQKNPKLHTIVGKLQFPKATEISSIFINNTSLVNVDVSQMNLGVCRNLSNIFRSCSSLTTLDVSNWNTGACENMYNIFAYCPSLASLDVSGWDTGTCTNMQGVFSDCSSLTTLDVSGWNTGACTNMSGMFQKCSSLTNLDVSNWNTGACTNMGYMFNDCTSLTSLDVSGWDTAACTIMSSMFNGCSSLTNLDVSNWNTGACTNMSSMFNGCSSLTSLDVSGWDFSKCTTTYRFVSNCKSLDYLKLGGGANPLLTNILSMFAGSGFKLLDIDEFDVSAVINMGSALASLPNITEIVIPNWITQNVENMSELFGYCKKLQKVDISGFIMSNVTNCNLMFYYCDALHTLKFPNMGQLKADATNNKTISFTRIPLGTAGEESLKAFKDMFTLDRINDLGYTERLTVQLSTVSKALLTEEEIAAITAKGYTIA